MRAGSSPAPTTSEFRLRDGVSWQHTGPITRRLWFKSILRIHLFQCNDNVNKAFDSLAGSVRFLAWAWMQYHCNVSRSLLKPVMSDLYANSSGERNWLILWASGVSDRSRYLCKVELYNAGLNPVWSTKRISPVVQVATNSCSSSGLVDVDYKPCESVLRNEKITYAWQTTVTI